MELRGKRIEEYGTPDLHALHEQIDAELDKVSDTEGMMVDKARLDELYAIEDELERRNERL